MIHHAAKVYLNEDLLIVFKFISLPHSPVSTRSPPARRIMFYVSRAHLSTRFDISERKNRHHSPSRYDVPISFLCCFLATASAVGCALLCGKVSFVWLFSDSEEAASPREEGNVLVNLEPQQQQQQHHHTRAPAIYRGCCCCYDQISGSRWFEAPFLRPALGDAVSTFSPNPAQRQDSVVRLMITFIFLD